jgi:hypothetical protein
MDASPRDSQVMLLRALRSEAGPRPAAGSQPAFMPSCGPAEAMGTGPRPATVRHGSATRTSQAASGAESAGLRAPRRPRACPTVHAELIGVHRSRAERWKSIGAPPQDVKGHCSNVSDM